MAAPEQTSPILTMVPVQPQANPMMEEEMNRAQREANAQAAFASRYGINNQGGMGGVAYRGLGSNPSTYTPPAAGVPAPAGAPKGGLPTVLDEKLLKITLDLYLIKPLPQK